MNGFCLHAKVLFKNVLYDKIESTPENLAQGVIDLGYNKRGGYFTALPISNYEYRKGSPTKAKLEYCQIKGYHCFYFKDDWGRETYNLLIVDSGVEVWDYVQRVIKHAAEIDLI
jgi:hypothetical protein